MQKMTNDTLDLSILKHLCSDARLTNVELSALVNLSPSACSRRVQRLERSGVIRGYHAHLDERRLGHTVTAFVQVSLRGQEEKLLRDFEAAVADAPSITFCYLMSGAADYLLRITATDLPDYERIHAQLLSKLPGVARIQSSFALREVVSRPQGGSLEN